MSATPRSSFAYVTIIRTTPPKLWEALTNPALVRQYWYGVNVGCAWKRGAPWRLSFPDGRLADAGEVLEIDEPRRIVIRWQNEWNPELKAEGPSRCAIDLAPLEDAVKLTITHDLDRPDSKFIAGVASGWPYTLSNLKSLLETGEVATKAHPGHEGREMRANSRSYTATIEVPQPPGHVFECLTDVSKWWGGKDLQGRTRLLDDEFTIRHGDVHYSKQKLIEIIPGQRLVWLITESRLAWLETDKQEWTGTRLVFEVTPKGGGAVVSFTHEGLVPEQECHSSCSQGWNLVIKDYLFNFITEGRVAAQLYA
jgi:uncharacterized protein YndB with AHSA1/START domain